MSRQSFPKFWLTGDKQKLNTSSDFVNQLYDYRPTELVCMYIYIYIYIYRFQEYPRTPRYC